MKKIGRIFAGISAILFCGGLSTFLSHGISLLNTPKTAEISGVSQPGGGGAEPLIDPGSGSIPQTSPEIAPGIIQVDFIQSNIAQYIDTKVTVTPTTKFEAKIQYLSSLHDQSNGLSSSSSRLCFGYSITGGYNHWYWGIGDKNYDTSIPADLLPHTFFIDLSTMTYGYDDVVMNSTANFTLTDRSPTLFARRGDPTVINYCYQNLYYCRFYDNGDLVHDFVPCYNKNTNDLGEELGYGLYDTETEEFFGNSGTEKFYGKSFFEEGEEYKIFDFEQYFVDNGIMRKNIISATTITGTGAKTDPYILNSSEDFWWATKYINWANKSFSLASDIVLNEEKFDENGNASGGDGVVYSWTLRGAGYSNTNFDGNNHIVFGLYYNDENVSGVSLFRDAASLKNISVDNLFLKGKNAVAAFLHGYDRTRGEIENCHVLKGTIIGNTEVSGVCNAVKNIINCSNSATITGSGGTISGIVSYAKSCYFAKNYGNVTTSGYYAGGICACPSDVVRFVSCENYGNITAVRYAAGINAGCYGYVGTVREILRCKNYGMISGGYSACIMGYCSAKAIIDGCENYGKIDPSKSVCGAVTTQVYSAPNDDGDLIVTNCYIKGNGSLPFVYNVVDSGKVKLENNVYEVEDFTDNGGLLARTVSADGCAIMIKNFIFKVKAVGKLNNVLIASYTNNTRISMENVCFDIDQEVTLLWSKVIKFEKLDGVIVKTPTQQWYYGSNFSGFNISWRTGEINLNSMSSIGTFSPRLIEENLLGMGFQKKTT